MRFCRSKLTAALLGVAATVGLMGAMNASAPRPKPASVKQSPVVRYAAAAPPQPRKTIYVIKKRYVSASQPGSPTFARSRAVPSSQGSVARPTYPQSVASGPRPAPSSPAVQPAPPRPAPAPTTITGGSPPA